MEIHLILDNIRSVHNVGSIFRTADAAGVSMVYLVGTTSTPIDRFGRARKDLAKVALGAESSVAWRYVESAVELIQNLKKEGFVVIALEQDDRSISYGSLGTNPRVALIVGNEVDGVSSDLLELADHIVEIPMRGKKESLNVAVATGIALYELRR